MRDKIKFLPLLFFYIIIILIAQTDEFWGDEARYVMFATNLTHGYYSPRDNINLWNGPGYPIVLMPFVLLKLPLLTAKLSNALFLFLAVFYIYHTLHLYMQKRTALFFSYLLGIYIPFLRYIHRLLTEPLAIFLVCGFIFHFCKLHQDNKKFSWVHFLIASFYVGYLALTKIFFGYVITACLLLFLFLYLWKKKDTFKKTFLIYLFALLYCMPYLFYTYSLTGKIFYWGNSGGLSLYWMSTPYKDELGDWHIIDNSYKNHQEFFNKLKRKNLSVIEWDDELKKQAIQNIINHPLKYLKNWLANIGRLLFNYPYTNTPQSLSTYFYIIPNMFLVVLCILCIYPSYLGRRLIPFEIYALILFGLISFGGSSLLSAYNRQFQPLVPVFFLWISFILARILKVEIRKQ
jgi:hypothetical protein